MAKNRANRATKSIPLHGGLVQNADDLLVQPPGMTLAENVMFPRKDYAEKFPPLEETANLSAPALGYYNSFGFYANGTRSALLRESSIQISSDSGETYTQKFFDGDLRVQEHILSTAQQVGAARFDWIGLGDTGASPFRPSHYVVAYEVQTILAKNFTNERSVVIQLYSADGTLLASERYADHANPVLVYAGTDGQTARCYTVDTGTGDFDTYAISTSTITTSTVYAQNPYSYCQYYNSLGTGWYSGSSSLSLEDMRIGYAHQLASNNYNVKSSQGTPTSGVGVIAWKDDTANRIVWAKTTLGVKGADQALTAFTDASNVHYAILDCTHDATYAYFLIGSCDTSLTSAFADVWLAREPLAGGTVSTYQVISNYSSIPINGCLGVDTQGDLHYAVTMARGLPTDSMQVTTGRHRVIYAEIDDPFGTPSVSYTRDIYSHRVASSMVMEDGDLAVFAVQQWDNFNPDDGTIGGDPDAPALTPVHQKPMTTIILKNIGSSLRLVASIDAGQGKVVDGGEEEVTNYTCRMMRNSDDEYYIGNRNLLTAQDTFFYIHSSTGAAYASSNSREVLHSGTARMNIYHLNYESDCASLSFADGMLAGTSVPVWYDNTFYVSESTPLESPEVVGVVCTDTSADGASYNAYQAMLVAGEEPKVVTAVVAYTDANGRVHRSAPSQPLYVGNMTAATSNASTYSLTAYVTPPLSLMGEAKYYVEIYESLINESPQLAATQEINNNDAAGRVIVEWASILDPTTASKELDVAPYRTAKTLYTEGNVLAADPWPAFDMMVRNARRLYAHSISDPSTLYYSKTFENGVAPEFSAALTLSFGNERITALGAIDDKLLVWTDTDTWIVYGNGPDNTGANGDFFVERLPFEAGCTAPKSVVTMKDGVAFYSNTLKNFALITRDLQLIVLDGVETLAEACTPLGSLHVPKRRELWWFVTGAGQTTYATSNPTGTPFQPPRPDSSATSQGILVYSYEYKKWSTRVIPYFSTTRYMASGLIGDSTPIIVGNWKAYKETTDYSQSPLIAVETGWIPVQSLQDYGRMRTVTLLSKYLSSWALNGGSVEAGDLQVTLSYDYEGPDGTEDVFLFRANVDFNPADGERLQLVCKPSRQKCSAIKIKVQEVNTTKVEVFEPTYTKGRGFALLAADIEYSLKRGGSAKSLGAGRKA